MILVVQNLVLSKSCQNVPPPPSNHPQPRGICLLLTLRIVLTAEHSRAIHLLLLITHCRNRLQMRTFYLAAFILACALLSLVHASSDTKKLQEAQKMRASGNIAGAIGVLRTMSAKQPDNTRVLALLGDSLMESGDATEAHAMYRRLYCDYAADFNVSRQIQRMLEVAGGRLSMHGWPVHAFPSHRQPPARPSSP